MTRFLADPQLFDRPLKRQAIRVSELSAWCDRSGHALPMTVPELPAFDVVALESLLCAIERGVGVKYGRPEIDKAYSQRADREPPPPTVQRLVGGILYAARALDVPDPRNRRLIEEGDFVAALWELGASAHQHWRVALTAAVNAGELPTVDAETGLSAGPSGAAPVSRLSTSAGKLAKLLELGGTYSGSRGAWTFTDLPLLEAFLKASGVPGFSEKTLRKKLSEHCDSQAAGRAMPTAR